jgi:hypothetical protein
MRRFCHTGELIPAHCMTCSGRWKTPQGKAKAKAKAGSGGAGGGPSAKAAAAAGSSGQGSSGQGSSHHSAPPGRIIGLRTEEEAVQAAEAASGAQQTEPQPAGGGSTKKEKERLRKERQRQRKIEEAGEALQAAIEAMLDEAAGSVKAVGQAMAEAEKHASRCEQLAALVVEAKGLIEQARAAEAERARVAAEAAATAAAVNAAVEAAAAAERLQLDEEMAALTLRLQQVQARLGVSPMAPAPHPEEALCVLCLDARMDHIIIPCGHQCVCGPCAEALNRAAHPACPLCREPISITAKVFLG